MKAIKNKLTKKITRERLGKFLRAHKTTAYTLDIGCSGSRYARYFPNRVGLDIEKGEGVDVVGDAHNLPFNDKTFDVVLCTEVLEHLYDPQRAIDEMWRVLRDKGTLLLTTRFIFPIHNTPARGGLYYFRYTPDGLRHLFRGRWDIKSIQAEASPKDTLAILAQRAGRESKTLFGKAFWFTSARLIEYCPWRAQEPLLSSGYYVVCQKKIST